MQVSTEKKEGILNLITVTVPAEDVKSARSNVFKNYAKNAKIDGFRKGHIPTAVLEKNFSAQINGDTLDRVINDNIYEAIQESKLKVVDIVKVDLKSGDATSEVVFEAEVEVYPELEFKALEDLKLKKIVSEINDADIDNMVETLREQQAKWQVKDDATVAEKTRASIDFLGRCEGVEFEGGKASDFTLTIGETSMIPGFTEQIMGHKAGDKFTINVKFPEEYHAENLKGKDAEFDITVNSVSVKVLPEVNEDFIKLFNLKDATMDTFRAELKKNMERELSRALSKKNSDLVFDALAAQYGEFDVPQQFVSEQHKAILAEVENYFKQYGMKSLPEQFKKNPQYLEDAKKRARLGVISSVVADNLNFKEASDAAVEAEINLIASAYDEPEKVVEQIKADKRSFAQFKAAAYEHELIAKIFEKAQDGEDKKSFSELVGR
ncbi:MULTISPECIES: trigger factor [Succinivibrio]|uniref:Trigger factor n=1 Tax=Succinivibrio faecicola TaxID=2820300 RepID=A0ABS7DHZ6_9GAMM|nr:MULTISPECIES: trigger factor [Succinivibrio]MBW7570924.1 trigger factor [Succinivibrio faecicola]MDD6206025.1 trigger factor [Succinivibrio sp.]